MSTDKTDTDAGINESGSVKDQLDELTNMAGGSGTDFDPKAKGVGSDDVVDLSDVSDTDLGEMIGDTIHMGTQGLVVVRGPHWERKRELCMKFGNCLVAVGNKYCPDLKTGREAALVMCAFALVGPPLVVELMISRGMIAEAEEEESSKSGDKSESKSA